VEEPGLTWQVASVVGFLCLVVAYLVNQRGRCSPESPRYLGVNAFGAGLLAAYSARIGEPVLMALEAFWCVASLLALYRTGPRSPETSP